MRYGLSSVHVAISVVAVGSVSFMVLAVGARTVDEVSMASFVTSWVALNTVVIAVGSAFDQLGPRLIAHDQDTAGSVLCHAVLIPAGVAMIAVLLLRIIGGPSYEVVPLGVYAISVSLWNGARSLMLSTGAFGRLGAAATVLPIGAAVVLGVAHITGGLSVGTLLYASACGNLGAACMALVGEPARRCLRSGFGWLSGSEYSLALTVVISSGCILLLSSGGVVLSGPWGVEPVRVIAFAGIVNVVRIPFMVLSSVTGPVNFEMAQRAASGNQVGAARLAVRLAAVAVIGGFGVALTVVAVGPRLLEAFIGDAYTFELGLALAVVVVEASIWAAVAVRTFGVATGRARAVLFQWVLAALVFTAISVVSSFGQQRIVIAPVMGSLVVVAVAGLWLVRRFLEYGRLGKA